MPENFSGNGGSGGGSKDGSGKPPKDHKSTEKTREPPSDDSKLTLKSSSSLKVSQSSSHHSLQKSGTTITSVTENNAVPEELSQNPAKQKGLDQIHSKSELGNVNILKSLASYPKSLTTTDPSSVATAPPPKKKVRVDVSARSLERNFMTVDRAMAEFLLLPEDLEGLPRTTRRSPYKDGPEITVLRRSDVVERAHTIWGSRGKMIAEQDQRRQEMIQRRLPRDHRRLADEMRERYGLFSSSGLVVLGAVMANASNLILKFVAWWFTGSLAMFAEFLHSVGDTANQLIVAICMHLSYKKPTIDHPYGYTNLKSVSAVIAGTLILSVGAGVSVYQGIEGLIHPHVPIHLIWAIGVLVFAGFTEMISLVMALQDVTKKASKRNMTFMQYVRYTQEPTVNVVLFEDCGAVLSVVITLTCLGLCWAMNTHIPDCAGSIIEGILFGVISVTLIRTNATFLIGKQNDSMKDYIIAINKKMLLQSADFLNTFKLEKINAELEADVMVRAIHDVKGIDLGNFNVRYKAELDFDGRELTRAYLDRVDMNQLFNSTKEISNVDELEDFMLRHGEALVDMLGGEIDRIEQKLKEQELSPCGLRKSPRHRSIGGTTSSNHLHLSIMVTTSAVHDPSLSSPTAASILFRGHLVRTDDLAPINQTVCNLLRDNFVENPSRDTYCNWAWDNVLCWPPTPPGSTTKQRCPRHKGVDPSNFVEKRCDTTGKWARWSNGTDTTPNGWTNYTGCFYAEVRGLLEQLGSADAAKHKMDIAAKTRKIEFVGLCVSLAALLASLIIFYRFRSLRNNRTRIHKNLFVAMVIQVLVRLTLYTDQALIKPDGRSPLPRLPDGIENTPLVCEAAYILLEYARTAMFMWMFVEGLYLHNMVTVTVFQDKVYTWLYTLLGWGAPVILTAAWAVTTAMYFGADKRCWFGYNLTKYFWILEGPRIGVVSLNFLFLLNIMRVLIVKLRQSHTSEIEQVRKAVRAAFVLLPLLGITNLTNMTISPVDRAAWEFALWSYVTYFLRSFQGFFIAILYCFNNGEVRIAVAKSISNYWSLRSRHFHARRHSALPGIYVMSAAPSIGAASESPTTPAPNEREKPSSAWMYICCQGAARSNTSQCAPPETSV